MGIMTAFAFYVFYSDAQMSSDEGVALKVMATGAKLLNRLRQKRSLRGFVRPVAPQAVARRGRMRTAFGHLVLKDSVAVEANIRCRGHEQRGQTRLVGIVALRALSPCHRRVRALPGLDLPANIRMTGITQSSLFLCDHAAEIAAVGRMAGQAHSRCERHVIRSGGLFRHQVAMAISAKLRAFRLEQLALWRCVGVMTCRAVAATHRLMCKGLYEIHLGLHMAGVADRIHAADHDIRRVGTVRVVAGCAHILCKGHMDVTGLLGLRKLGVAAEAQLPSFGIEKSGELGGMRLMA